MFYNRPYCFVALFVGLRYGDWLCGGEDGVDPVIQLDWVLLGVCGGFWVEFGGLITFISELS